MTYVFEVKLGFLEKKIEYVEACEVLSVDEYQKARGFFGGFLSLETHSIL